MKQRVGKHIAEVHVLLIICHLVIIFIILYVYVCAGIGDL